MFFIEISATVGQGPERKRGIRRVLALCAGTREELVLAVLPFGQESGW